MCYDSNNQMKGRVSARLIRTKNKEADNFTRDRISLTMQDWLFRIIVSGGDAPNHC